MARPFKLRSQGSSFKMMGSSPFKEDEEDYGDAPRRKKTVPMEGSELEPLPPKKEKEKEIEWGPIEDHPDYQKLIDAVYKSEGLWVEDK